MWNVILDFLQEFVVIFYVLDEDVIKDYELQFFVKDIYENGFFVREGDVDYEFFRSLQKCDQLVYLLMCIVFGCLC